MKEKNGRIIMDVSEISAIGFHAKYVNPTHSEYEVTRGKTKVFRWSAFYIFMAVFLTIISFRFLPSGTGWVEVLAWAPRFISIGLVVMGILNFKESQKILPLLIFSEKGIHYQNKTLEWEHISRLYVEYTRRGNSVFDLCIQHKDQLIRVDIKNVDEFSEDVGYTANKYHKKYKVQHK